MSELEPTFLVRVRLDGDDDPAEQTANVRAALAAAVSEMEADGLIVASEDAVGTTTRPVDGYGTNALIDSLWRRGDLGMAAATFERRRSSITAICEDLGRLGVPEDVLAPIRDLIKVPIND